jgi:HEAT repeat protein
MQGVCAAILLLSIVTLEEEAEYQLVLRYLSQVESSKQGQEFFSARGDKLFPVFERILKDKASEPRHIEGALRRITGLPNTDRKRFLEYAVDSLSHSDVLVRFAAIELLAQIGSASDAAPVVALLSDKEWTNGIAAAKALAAIGDKRTLAAMNAWLASSDVRWPMSGSPNEDLRKHVAKYRDALRGRLEKKTKE